MNWPDDSGFVVEDGGERQSGRRGAIASAWPEWRARLVFAAVVAYLLVLAYVVHRLPNAENLNLASELPIVELLGLLWLMIVAEGLVRLATTSRRRSWWREVGVMVLIILIPPLRLAIPEPERDYRVWLPRLGWVPVGAESLTRLEKAFSVPMIGIALMVLPVLAADYALKDRFRAYPGLELFLHICNAVIWFAFAIEFVVMFAVAEEKLPFCARNWLNLVIIVLPVVEFLPALRMARLGRALPQIHKLGRLGSVYGKVYRLRGLLTRLWRALLILNLFQRLLERDARKRLQRLRRELANKEKELRKLRREITFLEAQLAQEPDRQPPTTEGTRQDTETIPTERSS